MAQKRVFAMRSSFASGSRMLEKVSGAIERLLEVMRRLRDPKTGCPWDLEQNFQTIAPHTLEETYELIEAIETNQTQGLIDELGDLLFQVIFYAQLGSEARLFDFEEIASRVCDKMIERHPHIFGSRDVKNADDVLVNWEADKAAKRQAQSALDGISAALPALLKAVKLQKRAARVGFDWAEPKGVLDKIREEIDELEKEIDQKAPQEYIKAELGDLLFAVINLARKLEIEPESALRATNRKFEKRFREVEARLQGQNATLEEMEKIWIAIKNEEQ